MFFMISVLFRETDYKTGEECSAGVEGSVVHAVGAVVRPVEEVVNPGVQFKQEVTHGRESMRGGQVPELVLGGTGVGDFACFGVYLVDVFPLTFTCRRYLFHSCVQPPRKVAACLTDSLRRRPSPSAA